MQRDGAYRLLVETRQKYVKWQEEHAALPEMPRMAVHIEQAAAALEAQGEEELALHRAEIAVAKRIRLLREIQALAYRVAACDKVVNVPQGLVGLTVPLWLWRAFTRAVLEVSDKRPPADPTT